MKNLKNNIFFLNIIFFFFLNLKKIREGFDKIWTFLIEHLKANKGEFQTMFYYCINKDTW